MPPEGSVGKHSALQVREKLRTEFLPSPKLGVLLGAGDLTPGLTRPLPACPTPWKAAISDSTFALFLTKFLLGLGASEMGSSDEGRWVLPATVILEAQMKDSSGRPGPTVIRAVGPQPTAGMGLTNPLPMTRQSSLCPDTFITPTADTAVLGHRPPSVVVVRGQGCQVGEGTVCLGSFVIVPTTSALESCGVRGSRITLLPCGCGQSRPLSGTSVSSMQPGDQASPRSGVQLSKTRGPTFERPELLT